MAGDWSLQPGDIPWGNRLGLELVSIGDGLSSLRVGWREELADEDETLATGVLTSLIDQACGVAVMSRLGRRLAISTLNLKVDHVRSPRRDAPRQRGRIVTTLPSAVRSYGPKSGIPILLT